MVITRRILGIDGSLVAAPTQLQGVRKLAR